jgi:hypothetical protein
MPRCAPRIKTATERKGGQDNKASTRTKQSRREEQKETEERRGLSQSLKVGSRGSLGYFTGVAGKSKKPKDRGRRGSPRSNYAARLPFLSRLPQLYRALARYRALCKRQEDRRGQQNIREAHLADVANRDPAKRRA